MLRQHTANTRLYRPVRPSQRWMGYRITPPADTPGAEPPHDVPVLQGGYPRRVRTQHLRAADN